MLFEFILEMIGKASTFLPIELLLKLKEYFFYKSCFVRFGGIVIIKGDVFKRSISLGCAKVNISTQLKYAFIDGFVGYHKNHSTEYNPLKVLDAQLQELKAGITENIKLFGSAGKA